MRTLRARADGIARRERELEERARRLEREERRLAKLEEAAGRQETLVAAGARIKRKCCASPRRSASRRSPPVSTTSTCGPSASWRRRLRSIRVKSSSIRGAAPSTSARPSAGARPRARRGHHRARARPAGARRARRHSTSVRGPSTTSRRGRRRTRGASAAGWTPSMRTSPRVTTSKAPGNEPRRARGRPAASGVHSLAAAREGARALEPPGRGGALLRRGVSRACPEAQRSASFLARREPRRDGYLDVALERPVRRDSS